MMGARDECTRVHMVHEWCTSTEWCKSMERCMRTSGARVGVVHKVGARDGCTRVRGGAREVHEIT